MAAIKFNCPECGQRLEAPERSAGLALNCPCCQKDLQVPRTSQNSVLAPPPVITPPPLPQASGDVRSPGFLPALSPPHEPIKDKPPSLQPSAVQRFDERTGSGNPPPPASEPLPLADGSEGPICAICLSPV